MCTRKNNFTAEEMSCRNCTEYLPGGSCKKNVFHAVSSPSVLSFRYVFQMMNTAIKKVKISDTGMEYSTPSSPKNIGRRRANPTPNTTSRNRESMVEASALPTAYKKMKQALFTQARIIMHR